MGRAETIVFPIYLKFMLSADHIVAMILRRQQLVKQFSNNILIVRQGWAIWLPRQLLFLAPLAFACSQITPHFAGRIFLLCMGFALIAYFRRGAAFARIEKAGVSWWNQRRWRREEWLVLDWKDIDACAYKSVGAAHILRIFLRQIPNNWPSLAPGSRPSLAQQSDELFRPWTQKEDHFDIDFSVAEQPDAAVKHAFDGCVQWISSTRGLASGHLAVREFGLLTASEAKSLGGGFRASRWTTWAILCFIVSVGFGFWFPNG